MKEYVGVCAYCGQVVVSDKDFGSQAMADQWATENCSCDEAEVERQRRESARAAERQVEALFGSECGEYGFKPVPGDVLLRVMTLVRLVARGEMANITAVLPCGGGGKLSVSITSKGKVKVSRSVGNSQALEA